MSSFGQLPGQRHVYRYKAWLMVLMCLIAVIIGGSFTLGILGSTANGRTHSVLPVALFAVLPLAFAAYFLLLGLRSRIVIEGSQIAVRGAFTDKSADLSEIEGLRTVSSRNGSYTRLILKEGRGSITISNSFNTDDAYSEFFQKIPDLDERDREALLREIEQQQDLGSTPEERLSALSRAKTLSIVLLVVTVLLGIAVAFGAKFLDLSTVRLCTVLLAAAPLLAGYFAWRSPLLYAVVKNKKDPRAEVSFIPFIAGLALIFNTSSDHFVTMQPLYPTWGVAAIGLLALYATGAKSSARGAIVALLLFAGIYGYGLAAAADIAFDNSPAVPYTTTVVGGHVSHGKSTSYYLRLAPWGPVDRQSDVSVSHSTYQNSHIGDNVCLVLHSGSLHAQWFRVVPCSDSSEGVEPAPPQQ